jgi:hypothetical protein
MTQTVDLEDLTPAQRTLLDEVARYDGPGYVPIDADWAALEVLGFGAELVTWGAEPLGTYGPDGREEYGTVVHLTAFGRDQLAA